MRNEHNNNNNKNKHAGLLLPIYSHRQNMSSCCSNGRSLQSEAATIEFIAHNKAGTTSKSFGTVRRAAPHKQEAVRCHPSKERALGAFLSNASAPGGIVPIAFRTPERRREVVAIQRFAERRGR